MPLISVVLKRCSYIMKRMFEISIAVLSNEWPKDSQQAVVERNERFLSELKRVYQEFVDQVEERCRVKIMDDFESLTKVIDWDLLTGFPSAFE